LDRFGTKENLPYHVRLSLEGIPQHAWNKDIANKVLGDEAIIHHVEEETLDRLDHRVFHCWAFSRDPSIIHHVEEETLDRLDHIAFHCWAFSRDSSRIPQLVYFTLTKHNPLDGRQAQVHFSRPREIKQGHVFRVIIHIVVVEDLLFYHYPREELLADGKIPWREFSWQYGRLDGEIDDDEIQPPTRFYGRDMTPHKQPRDDEDGDRFLKRSRSRSFIGGVSSWIEGRSRGRDPYSGGNRSRDFHRGESSRGRARSVRDSSDLSSKVISSEDEDMAKIGFWQSKGTMKQLEETTKMEMSIASCI
jgi:hypothetical protein